MVFARARITTVDFDHDGSEPFTARTASTTRDQAWSIAAADLSGDGLDDLIVAAGAVPSWFKGLE